MKKLIALLLFLGIVMSSLLLYGCSDMSGGETTASESNNPSESALTETDSTPAEETAEGEEVDGIGLLEGEELLMLQPSYIGEPVTTTDHTFKKEDFRLLALYAGGLSSPVTAFTFEVIDLKDGMYTVRFHVGEYEEDLFVPLEIDIYE